MTDPQISLGAVVLDAADLSVESAFWSSLLGGTVEEDGDWHTIRHGAGPAIAIQLAPNHVRPAWPDGPPQQVHLDFDVADIAAAHERALAAGAEVLHPEAGPDLTATTGFQVYADPAGHPFCLCWGQ